MRSSLPIALARNLAGEGLLNREPETLPQLTYGKWVENCRAALVRFDAAFIRRPDDVSTSDLRLIASDLARRYVRALRTLPDNPRGAIAAEYALLLAAAAVIAAANLL